MLRNIDQTLEFYHRLASRPGGFPAPLLEPRTYRLAAAPTSLGLPKNYIDFVHKYKIENVSLGALELMPMSGEDVWEVLRLVNGQNKNPLVPDCFMHVSNYEGDLILVVKSSEMHDDSRVYFLDISTGYFPEPVCLANNFEDFVITAANLDQRVLDDQDVTPNSFIDIVRLITPSLGKQSQECWQKIYEMYS